MEDSVEGSLMQTTVAGVVGKYVVLQAQGESKEYVRSQGESTWYSRLRERVRNETAHEGHLFIIMLAKGE
jgi:hypothetical protein